MNQITYSSDNLKENVPFLDMKTDFKNVKNHWLLISTDQIM